MAKSAKSWENAKSGGSDEDPLAMEFVSSLDYDLRLWKHDIAGSLAHARMLAGTGLISKKDLAGIEKGLGQIADEIQGAGVKGWPGWKKELEDVHMCIEAALIEKIGPVGGKLHTGRSRNDQVVLDLKLWQAEALRELQGAFQDLFRAWTALALREGEMLLPAYTHLQRAQPATVGAHAVAWLTALDRCLNRFLMLSLVNASNPLGSGAAAGSTLPLNRHATAEALNIGEPSPSSLDSTGSRDDAADFLWGLAMTAMTLSRWAEQWIIYMSSEFGYLSLGEAYTTGSSMMPQKRNPDILELIRGRCGSVYGHLVALMTILKGLPAGYQRDLQLDKVHLFGAYDLVIESLWISAGLIDSALFSASRMDALQEDGFTDATALAEYLVLKGLPFRTAHQQVGALVRMAQQRGCRSLGKLTLDQMRSICDRIESDVTGWLGPANVTQRYQTYGNAGPSGYKPQLALWVKRLAPDSVGQKSKVKSRKSTLNS